MPQPVCVGGCAAIVLAAGFSRRMGADKLGLPWEGGTVLSAALRPFLALPELDPVLLVVRPGQDPGEVGRACVVENPEAAEGMGASLRVGVAATPPDTACFVLGLGDMPGLSTATVRGLLAAWRAGEHGILVPTFAGRRGHPVLVAGSYRDDLLRVRGDVGAREVIRAHAEDARFHAVDDPAVVLDLDAPGDLPRHPQPDP